MAAPGVLLPVHRPRRRRHRHAPVGDPERASGLCRRSARAHRGRSPGLEHAAHRGRGRRHDRGPSARRWRPGDANGRNRHHGALGGVGQRSGAHGGTEGRRARLPLLRHARTPGRRGLFARARRRLRRAGASGTAGAARPRRRRSPGHGRPGVHGARRDRGRARAPPWRLQPRPARHHRHRRPRSDVARHLRQPGHAPAPGEDQRRGTGHAHDGAARRREEQLRPRALLSRHRGRHGRGLRPRRELPEPGRPGGRDPRRRGCLQRDAGVRSAEAEEHRHPQVPGRAGRAGAGHLRAAGGRPGSARQHRRRALRPRGDGLDSGAGSARPSPRAST